MIVQTEVDLDERTPLRTFWFADKVHAGFLGSSVGLESIARDARAHDVLPGRRTAAIARDDVVQVQVLPIKHPSAILASVLISLEYVVASEFHFFLRQSIKEQQQNHPWNSNLE